MSEAPPTHPTPPTSPQVFQPVGLLGRCGTLLVAGPRAELPDRCFKCNQPALGYRKKCELSWHHPTLYLLILAGLVVYAIVAICVRNKATVYVPVCAPHRAKRRRGIIIGLCIMAASPVAFWAGVKWDRPEVFIFGLFTLFGGLVVAVLAAQTVTPATITSRGIAYLKGVHPALLEGLTEVPMP